VIVCIAVDHRIALRAIAQQYDKLASDKRPKEAIARDYLGKIIQLPIRLGRAPNVDGFIDGRLFTEVIDKDVDWEMLGFGVDDPPIISDTSESSQEYNQVDDNSVEPRGGGGDGGPPSGTDGTDVTDSPDLRIAHDDRDVGRIEGSETDFDESEAERLDEVMPDRRDLNRFFPGSKTGNLTSRVANLIFNEIIKKSDYGIELHTAAQPRANFPNVRGDMKKPDVRKLATAFGAELILDGRGPDGSLRREATKAGCPTIILEAGEPLKIQEEIMEDILTQATWQNDWH